VEAIVPPGDVMRLSHPEAGDVFTLKTNRDGSLHLTIAVREMMHLRRGDSGEEVPVNSTMHLSIEPSSDDDRTALKGDVKVTTKHTVTQRDIDRAL
jgi:hypothetical protein